jgi:hypothetical protein
MDDKIELPDFVGRELRIYTNDGSGEAFKVHLDATQDRTFQALGWDYRHLMDKTNTFMCWCHCANQKDWKAIWFSSQHVVAITTTE